MQMKVCPKTPQQKLGQRIGECRKALGISRREFAKLINSDLGFVTKIESGSVDLEFTMLEKCARAFCLMPSELIELIENEFEFVLLSEEADIDSDDFELRECG